MRGLTNKQDAVRRALAREFITMVFRGENNKLSGIKEYADRFGVGAGTVQGALADLKADCLDTIAKSRRMKPEDVRPGFWGRLLSAVLRVFAPLM